MTHQPLDHSAPAFGQHSGLAPLPAGQKAGHSARNKVPLRAACWLGWQNLCRLFLIKVWFQVAVVLSVTGSWLWNRDSASTVATVSITLVLSSWMMSRERIRRSLVSERTSSGLGGRMDDDWTTFERPFLCLEEINQKRKAQERKDRTACRIGIICTVLAGIVAVVGFQR